MRGRILRVGRRTLAGCAAAVGLLGACGSPDPIAEATALLENNEVDAAVELLREAIDASPGDPALNHLYGRALLANEQESLAAWPLRRAAQDPEYAVKSGLLLTRSFLLTNNAHEAVRSADAVLALEPDNLDAIRMRAEARAGVNEDDLALEDLDRLIDAFPDEFVHREKKLNILLEKERFDEAETVLTDLAEAIEARDDLPEGSDGLVCSRWTQLAVRRGDAEQAKEKLLDCLERYPDSRPVLHQAIAFYDQEGDPEKSNQLLRDAIAARPGDADLQSVLAERLNASKEVDEATRLLEEAANRLDTPAAWIALRNHQVQNDDMEGALASTDRLLQAISGVSPSDPKFSYDDIPEQRLFEAAVVVAMTGDFARAEEMKKHLDETSHRHLLEARIHYERDELQEALDAWEEAFRLFPSNTGARHLAGMAALRLGQTDLAIEHLRNALRTRAAGSDVGVVLANVYNGMRNPRLALDSLLYHLRENPKDYEAMRLQSRIAMRSGNDQIAQNARSMLAQDRIAMAVADQAHEIQLRHGPDVALQFLSDGLVIDLDEPEHADGLAAWIEMMLALDRGDEALKRIARLASAHPDDANLRTLHGATLSSLGDLEGARTELDAALALDPDNHQALASAARLDLQEEKIDEAVTRLKRAAKLAPRDPSPIYAAAEALSDAGRRDEAHALLAELLRESPWEGRAALLLAQDALDAGRHDAETLALAQRATVFYAETGSAAFETLGKVQLARGDPDAAIAALRRAATLGTPGPSGLYRIATALTEAGDKEGAIRALETALTVEEFPEKAEARKALSALQPTDEG